MEEYDTKIFTIEENLIREEKIALLRGNLAVKEAAQLLRQGEVVAFPTETVYGLGADATNASAVKKIYQAKGRPQDNPLIVHIANLKQLKEIMKGELSIIGRRLITTFWPGPLTIIVQKKDKIPKQTTANLDSVAIRMPSHPLTQAIIEETGLPIAAPSANRSGAPSPTKASHVIADLKGKIPLIIDGGAAEVGIESTVVDIRDDKVKILRPGGISREEIRAVIGKNLYEMDFKANHNIGQKNPNRLRQVQVERPVAPGMKYRHYSPETPLYLIQDEEALNKLLFSTLDKNIGLLLSDETFAKYQSHFKNVKVLKMGSRNNPKEIAANIFDLLRHIDEMDIDQAYVESIPEKGIGEAVMNRITKASIKE